MLGRLAPLLFTVAGGLCGASPAYADPAQLVRLARQHAAKCEYQPALATARRALDEAQQVWAPDAPGRLVLEQDLATYLNQTFAPREAETHARNALKFAESRSPTERALILQNLAIALSAQGRSKEAARTFEETIMLLAGSPDPAVNVNAQIAYGLFEINVGRAISGLAHLEQAAEIAKAPAVPLPLRATAQLQLADGYRRLLRIEQADAAVSEAERIRAAAGLAASARLALIRINIMAERGRIATALESTQAMESAGIASDPCDPTLGVDFAHRRGSLHLIRRELPEASAAFTSALAQLTRLRLTANPREAEISYGLAVVAALSGELDRATALFDRTAAAFRRYYGGASEAEAQTITEKAQMLADAGRSVEAVAAARNALALLNGRVEQAPLAKAYAHAVLGSALRSAGDPEAGEVELRQALAQFEAVRGASSFDLAPGLETLGEIALAANQAKVAEGHFRRAIEIQRNWGGNSAIALGRTLSKLSAAQAARGAREAAMGTSAEAVTVLQRRLAIGETRPWNDAELERRSAHSILVQDLKLAAAPLAARIPGSDVALVRRMLGTIQLSTATSTGSAIAQVSTRLQSDPRLATLLGERNDLAAEWRAIQDELIESLTLSSGEPIEQRREALVLRQQEIGVMIGAVDRQLVSQNPKLDLLLKSRAVELSNLQNALAPNEAALVLNVGDTGSYAVLITRRSASALRSEMRRDQVDRLVGRVRATLDPARWRKQLATFDSEAAQLLSAEFVQPVLPLLSGVDTLLIVPDGPLASLPFSVLPTTAPPPITGSVTDYRTFPWLVRRFALATFPSAASIVALRGPGRRAAPSATMLGVGAPVLDGAAGTGSNRGNAVLHGMSRRGLADVALLRTMASLPDTRTELERMVRVLAGGGSRLLLGTEAVERTVKQLPLESFGVIVFATHGLVAGELAGFAEPGLVLTPPKHATPDDDGFLTASEAALLKMNADWVILSACNTAASDGSPRAEPLSGLAKSFFYAGARSLLVSHWAVDSEAAAKLTVSAVQSRVGGLSSAMALRAAAIHFIDDRDDSLRTHPFFWAPFELIGG